MPKQHFIKISNFLLLKFWKACRTSSLFLSFCLIFFSFLTGQTPSEDDFSEDDGLKPLIP